MLTKTIPTKTLQRKQFQQKHINENTSTKILQRKQFKVKKLKSNVRCSPLGRGWGGSPTVNTIREATPIFKICQQ